MVNGVLLLVDAAEGPMPQTRFVMQKALELNHKLIIVVNKVDRPDARIAEVQDEILELLIDLNASDEQLDSPIVFCSGRAGTASRYADKEGKDLTPLFDTILNHIPPMTVDETAPLQILVSSIDYNDYVGRIGIGRIERRNRKGKSGSCRLQPQLCRSGQTRKARQPLPRSKDLRGYLPKRHRRAISSAFPG